MPCASAYCTPPCSALARVCRGRAVTLPPTLAINNALFRQYVIAVSVALLMRALCNNLTLKTSTQYWRLFSMLFLNQSVRVFTISHSLNINAASYPLCICCVRCGHGFRQLIFVDEIRSRIGGQATVAFGYEERCCRPRMQVLVVTRAGAGGHEGRCWLHLTLGHRTDYISVALILVLQLFVLLLLLLLSLVQIINISISELFTWILKPTVNFNMSEILRDCESLEIGVDFVLDLCRILRTLIIFETYWELRSPLTAYYC